METKASQSPRRLSVRDRQLELSSPQIMGVLNATPDSFSDGGQFNSLDAALGHIGLMVADGASIIDIGGESTRPGANPVSRHKELDRVMPILEKAIAQFPDTLFSIDTTKYAVAKQALQRGVHLVNDISGGQQEPRLPRLCATHNAGYILMHSQGIPKTMQQNPTYDDVVADIKSFFQKKITWAREAGVQHLIIDPGIGFGKTTAHNITILKHLKSFKTFGLPLMVGASRKATIGHILGGRDVSGRITGTVAAHYQAMINGANIIRVHDVKQAHDSLLVFNTLGQ